MPRKKDHVCCMRILVYREALPSLTVLTGRSAGDLGRSLECPCKRSPALGRLWFMISVEFKFRARVLGLVLRFAAIRAIRASGAVLSPADCGRGCLKVFGIGASRLIAEGLSTTLWFHSPRGFCLERVAGSDTGNSAGSLQQSFNANARPRNRIQVDKTRSNPKPQPQIRNR